MTSEGQPSMDVSMFLPVDPLPLEDGTSALRHAATQHLFALLPAIADNVELRTAMRTAGMFDTQHSLRLRCGMLPPQRPAGQPLHSRASSPSKAHPGAAAAAAQPSAHIRVNEEVGQLHRAPHSPWRHNLPGRGTRPSHCQLWSLSPPLRKGPLAWRPCAHARGCSISRRHLSHF